MTFAVVVFKRAWRAPSVEEAQRIAVEILREQQAEPWAARALDHVMTVREFPELYGMPFRGNVTPALLLQQAQKRVQDVSSDDTWYIFGHVDSNGEYYCCIGLQS